MNLEDLENQSPYLIREAASEFKNAEAMKKNMGSEKAKFKCCTKLKTKALKMILKRYN